MSLLRWIIELIKMMLVLGLLQTSCSTDDSKSSVKRTGSSNACVADDDNDCDEDEKEKNDDDDDDDDNARSSGDDGDWEEGGELFLTASENVIIGACDHVDTDGNLVNENTEDETDLELLKHMAWDKRNEKCVPTTKYCQLKHGSEDYTIKDQGDDEEQLDFTCVKCKGGNVKNGYCEYNLGGYEKDGTDDDGNTQYKRKSGTYAGTCAERGADYGFIDVNDQRSCTLCTAAAGMKVEIIATGGSFSPVCAETWESCTKKGRVLDTETGKCRVTDYFCAETGRILQKASEDPFKYACKKSTDVSPKTFTTVDTNSYNYIAMDEILTESKKIEDGGAIPGEEGGLLHDLLAELYGEGNEASSSPFFKAQAKNECHKMGDVCGHDATICELRGGDWISTTFRCDETPEYCETLDMDYDWSLGECIKTQKYCQNREGKNYILTQESGSTCIDDFVDVQVSREICRANNLYYYPNSKECRRASRVICTAAGYYDYYDPKNPGSEYSKEEWGDQPICIPYYDVNVTIRSVNLTDNICTRRETDRIRYRIAAMFSVGDTYKDLLPVNDPYEAEWTDGFISAIPMAEDVSTTLRKVPITSFTDPSILQLTVSAKAAPKLKPKMITVTPNPWEKNPSEVSGFGNSAIGFIADVGKDVVGGVGGQQNMHEYPYWSGCGKTSPAEWNILEGQLSATNTREAIHGGQNDGYESSDAENNSKLYVLRGDASVSLTEEQEIQQRSGEKIFVTHAEKPTADGFSEGEAPNGSYIDRSHCRRPWISDAKYDHWVERLEQFNHFRRPHKDEEVRGKFPPVHSGRGYITGRNSDTTGGQIGTILGGTVGDIVDAVDALGESSGLFLNGQTQQPPIPYAPVPQQTPAEEDGLALTGYVAGAVIGASIIRGLTATKEPIHCKMILEATYAISEHTGELEEDSQAN